MKTFRILTVSLFLISGILHLYPAFKGNIDYSSAIWMGDGILYLVLGVLQLLKKRFAFWLAFIPVLVSFLAPHMIPGHNEWIIALNYIELVAVICCSIVLLSWKKETKSIIRFQWTLRVLSCLIIVFFLLMFIGETPSGEKTGETLSTSAIIGLSILGIGLIGLVLAWRWELLGGIIALASFVGLGITDRSIFLPTLLYIYPLIAILFIVLWATKRNTVSKSN
jgi:hypothetical protein